MQNHTVKENSKLLEYMRKYFPSYSNTKSKQLLQSGMVVVNDEIVTYHAHLLRAGDKLRFESRPVKTRARLHYDPGFPILYEDESIIVIEKPTGLLTVATERIKNHTVYFKLTEYVRSKDPTDNARVFIVHRIDRHASGILVFAKTESVQNFLQDNWKKFEKRYYAVIEGIPKKKEGTVKSFLVEDKFRRVYSARESAESKLSITHYRVIEIWGHYSLVEILLETGRKNQVRVHMKDMGFPIAGDDKYGASTDPIGRLALHSFFLSIDHPQTGERKTFQTSLPFSKKSFIDKR